MGIQKCKTLLDTKTAAGILVAVFLCGVLLTHTYSRPNIYHTSNNRTAYKLLPVDLSQSLEQDITTTRLLLKLDSSTTSETIERPDKFKLLSADLSQGIELPDTVDQSYSMDNPIQWTPDWYETSYDLETLLMKRGDGIKERCRILNRSTQFKRRIVPKVGRGMMSLSENIRYCPTFKAGFTFWKSFKRDLPPHAYIPKEKVAFTVTRNPWHRLVSVWRDRFTLPKPGLAQHFMRGFCKGKSWESLPPFSEFIEKCLFANWNSGHRMNQHWAPTLDKCNICGKPDQLNFFIAQENMNQEATFMLKEHAGFLNASSFLDSQHSKVLRPTEGIEKGISARYQDEYKTLTDEQINKLWNIYKYEIYLFDYPRSPFVDFPKA